MSATEKPRRKYVRKKKPAPKKFKASFYVQAFRIASTGATDAEIARSLGISEPTLRSWMKKDEDFRNAVDDGHDVAIENGTTSFVAYVGGRLPPHLQRLWTELGFDRYTGDEPRNDWREVERVLTANGIRVRQQLFLHALISSNFHIAQACRRVNIPRSTFEHWRTSDPAFNELLAEIIEAKKDMFEAHFISLCESGNPAAIIHAVQSQCADRGYAKRIDMQHGGEVKVDLNVTVLSEEVIDRMPVRARRELLAAIEAAAEDAVPSEEAA